MIDPRDNEKQGQKEVKTPGREDDQGIDKGAKGTDGQKGSQRSDQPRQGQTQPEKK